MLSRLASLRSAPIVFLGLLAIVSPPALQADDRASKERAERSQRIAAERMAYANSADYNPYDTANTELVQTAYPRLEKGEFVPVIAELTTALAKAPYDVDLLPALASAYRMSGDNAKADEIRERWFGVIDSIVDSGDGRSPETAFKVITVREEYAVIRGLRLEPQGQKLAHHSRSTFDVMKVKAAQSGESFDLYFNIDLPHGWLRQQFGAGK